MRAGTQTNDRVETGDPQPFLTLDNNSLSIARCGQHHTLHSLMAFSFKFLISCRSQQYEKVSQGFCCSLTREPWTGDS